MKRTIDGVTYELQLSWGQWKKIARSDDDPDSDSVQVMEDAIRESLKSIRTPPAKKAKPFSGDIDALPSEVVMELVSHISNPMRADDEGPLVIDPIAAAEK